MADNSKVIKIRIHGKEYALKGEESEEYLQKVAYYIDRKMAEVSKNSVRMSASATAVLTSINIADDYFKLQESISDTKNELEEKKREIEVLKKELNDLKMKHTEVQLEFAKVRSKLEEKTNKK